MKKRGLKVNKPNAEQMKEWNALAENLYPRMRGKTGAGRNLRRSGRPC
jgi:hypothetical protein